MATAHNFYFISISPLLDNVPYNYLVAAERNELSLSNTRRLCTIFSASQARFDSYEQAKAFLDTINQKPNWEYSIQQCRQYR